MTRLYVAQQTAVASLVKSVKYYEGLGDRNDKKDRAGSSGSGGGGDKPTRLERDCERKK